MKVLRTLVLQPNLTICLPLTVQRALTQKRLVAPPKPLSLETLSKHHALSVVLPLVRKNPSVLSRQQNLVGLLHDLVFQVPRYEAPHVVVLKAGLSSNHCANLCNGPWWFGSRRHGIDAETEAAQCKATWDIEDSKALLVRGDSSTFDSSELLYSLDKARKCGELEAAGLLCGDSWRVVQNLCDDSLQQFSTDVCSNVRVMVMTITLWSPKA